MLAQIICGKIPNGIVVGERDYLGENMNILVYSREKQTQRTLLQKFKESDFENIINQHITIKCIDNREMLSRIKNSSKDIDVAIIDASVGDAADIKAIYEGLDGAMLVIYMDSQLITYDIYDLYPTEILVCPVTEKKLVTMAHKIQKKVEEYSDDYVSIKTKKNICRIKKSDINYIESDGHYLRIFCDGETVVCINKLSEFVAYLGSDFLQCHKSYAVNIKKIKVFEYTSMLLLNGDRVQISRRFKKKVKEAVLNSEI